MSRRWRKGCLRAPAAAVPGSAPVPAETAQSRRGAPAANCSSLRLMCAVAASACATQRGKSLPTACVLQAGFCYCCASVLLAARSAQPNGLKERLAACSPDRYALKAAAWSKQTKQVRKERLGRSISGHNKAHLRRTASSNTPIDRLPRVLQAASPAQRLLQPQSQHVLLV